MARKKRRATLVRGGNDGAYTPIPHDYLLYLARLKLAPNEWRVMMVVLRHTLGWHRLTAVISLGAFAKATGMRREHVSRAKVALAKSEVIAFTGQKIELLPVSATPTMQLPLLATGGLPESAIGGLPVPATYKDRSSKLPQKERAELHEPVDALEDGFDLQQPQQPQRPEPLPDRPISFKDGVAKFHERQRRLQG